MKVLIVTYYWVPAGGSGVQRWLKFVKYLRSFGIEPVIYTVENPNYPLVDTSLCIDIPENIEIIKSPILEPNNLLSRFKKKGSKTSAGFLNPNPTFFGKILQYIRANYFIPDARKFWVKPSVKKLKNYLKENTVDILITTGPPHSMHLIGLQLKKELGIKWVADFRDPWTDIDYFHQLPLTKKSIKKHHKLEKEVLKKADATLVIGKTMKENYCDYSNKIYVVTNGYDNEEDQKEKINLDETFSITHIGLMNADRNPKILWEVLDEICKENVQFSNDLEIKLIGKVAKEIDETLEKYSFKGVKKINYVPHNEVLNYQKKSQILLLAVNNVPSAKGIITGKIFEYLQAKRPILAIGPENGDLAEILNVTNSGDIVSFDNKRKLKIIITNLYNSYKAQNLTVDSKDIGKFHRQELTRQLTEILKEINNS
ncbi:glycosyltransferase family 4 protein [Tenacibaculum sp. E3R01]|uniref:glycosyltransferase family 4 protein n=1 Tax=Tenacibaculum sp. E3R01 TaxID=2267227 RepID=UPI0018F1290B|nr:glycosyltransferase family 4 protein [Tenacibaculum sp. E3R01]